MTTALEDKVTKAFIEENAQWFTFLRRERVETSEGGWTLGEEIPVERKLIETFDGPDGDPVGPVLNWSQRVFYEEDFTVNLQGGKLKYTLSGNALGARERLYVPRPSFPMRNGRIEFDVDQPIKTGDPNYWNGIGAVIRGQVGTYSWNGIGVDFGINDQLFPGIELLSLVIWDVQYGGDPTRNVVTIAGNAAAPLGTITFPAHLTLEAKDNFYRALAKGANGAVLEASGYSSNFLDGEAGIGIGPVINGNTTLSMSIDNFSMFSHEHRGRLVQSGRVGASGLRNTPAGRLSDTTATIVLPVGSPVQVGDLVNVEPAHVGGDPVLVGQWEVVDIGGRWAMDAEIVRHGG